MIDFWNPKNYRVPLLFIVILWVRAKRAELTTLFRVLLSHDRIEYIRTHLLLPQRNIAQRSTMRRIIYQFSSKTFINMVECLKGYLTHNPLNSNQLNPKIWCRSFSVSWIESTLVPSANILVFDFQGPSHERPYLGLTILTHTH